MMDDLKLEEGIAIIGMAGHFPGAENIEQFWKNIKHGVESVTFFSDEELLDSGVTTKQLQQPNYVKAKASLDKVEYFDAAFFGFTPEEAAITDPQQRLFLECAWEALESAGYNPKTCESPIGLYGGMGGTNTYLLRHLLPQFDLDNPEHNYKLMLGNDKDFLCTRISHKLNLTGPSMTIQTACSTSLVAVSMACQALLDYQCDMALAGGVSISFPQKAGYLYQQDMILSPDGHCRTFDADACGTVPGNGAGIVLLKRLDNAIECGDTIYAVIRGTVVNNDGAHKMSYTTPSVTAQTQAISEAIAIADILPETIRYVETHGTATILGDSIEVAALTQAYRSETQAKNYCALGSVKTNIGYLETAAGVAGLIKTVLALKNKQIPPSLHFKQPNPKIDFANSPFYVNTDLQDWPAHDTPRRAAVNAFGVGGTNAHIILEQAPNIIASEDEHSHQLIILSARSQNALQQKQQQLLEYLIEHPELNLNDVAYTLQIGRVEFDYRSSFICDSVEHAITQLRKPECIEYYEFAIGKPPTLVFMFDESNQAIQIDSTLYETENIFRETIDYCAHFLLSHLQIDLREVLYAHKQPQSNHVSDETITYSISFIVQYALAKSWMSWGIYPQAVMGRGIGEYIAACIAGVFSLEEALLLIIERCHFMEQENVDRVLFDQTLSYTEFCPPQLLYLSASTGDWVNPQEITHRNYWQKQLIAQDHIQAAFAQLPQSFDNAILLDISPQNTLYLLARQSLPTQEQQILATLIDSNETDNSGAMLHTLGQLWLQGINVDWKKMYLNETRLRIPLPTYPFERKRYWFDHSC